MEAGTYVTVGRVEDVPPGSVRPFRVGEEEIAVAHCEDGIFATQGHCLHLQGPLGHGRVAEGCVLTCPWHGWQYDVRTGENEFDRAIKLQTYEVQVEDGQIRVRI
jgi:nitrite reductase/ring-hydroxylating ferredoxin subunit